VILGEYPVGKLQTRGYFFYFIFFLSFVVLKFWQKKKYYFFVEFKLLKNNFSKFFWSSSGENSPQKTSLWSPKGGIWVVSGWIRI
jgi:hypothetical protein